MNNFRSYEYKDVDIIPTLSSVNSRDDVDISFTFPNGFKLDFPLIASPMKGIVSGKFAQQLSNLGGLAILHRFYKNEVLLHNDIEENCLWDYNYGLSVGLNSNDYEWMLDLNPKVMLVDVANGYSNAVRDYCETIKNHICLNGYGNQTLLMAGNVTTSEGVEALRDSGVDIARCLIGSGNNCSTRSVTGIGVGAITALQDCSTVNDIVILADGGIKSSGDACKALVAGADVLMSGMLFAETYESDNTGVIYGMASRTHQEDMKYSIKSVEGFDTEIEKKYSLEQFVREFGYGIRSCGTYLNAINLNEIRQNGEFVYNS